MRCRIFRRFLVIALFAIAAKGAYAQEVAADDPTIALPPISLKLQNATPQDLAQALSKALGSPISIKPAAAPNIAPTKITIDADKKPLWEIYATLHATYGISLIDDPATSGYALTWSAVPAPPAAQKSHTWTGFHSIAGVIERRGGDLHFTWTTLADPRIAPASVAKVVIISLTDNENTNLLPASRPAPAFQPAMTRVLPVTLTVPSPARIGTTVTIKAEVHYVLGDNRDVIVPVELKDVPIPK